MNKRSAVAVIGAVLLVGVAIVALLLQRSSSIAGRRGRRCGGPQTLERKEAPRGRDAPPRRGPARRGAGEFLELLRLAPESAAARTALEQAEQLLARKQEEERKAAEAGATRRGAARASGVGLGARDRRSRRRARDRLLERGGEGDPRRGAGGDPKQSRAAQRKAESQIRR